MTRTALAVFIALAVGFFSGGALAWRTAEAHWARTADAFAATASIERALLFAGVVENLDSGQSQSARTMLVKRMRAELAAAKECQIDPRCSSSLAALAPAAQATLVRAAAIN